MADRAERAQSFGAVAPDYDRLRPSAPEAALEWLVPGGCRVAVDLAAGTGLFTRELARHVAEVVAVEPDGRMRAVLAERSPAVRVVEGSGEAMPLGEASADALFVSSAWHWMDAERAVPEIARVLRDGGRFGVLWTGRDREVDWVRELDRAAAGSDSLTGPDVTPDGGGADRRRRPHRDVELPDGELFEHVEQQSFAFVRSMSVDDLIGSLATYSQVIVLEPADRVVALDRARATLVARFGEVNDLDVPMRSWCWRADRVSRSAP